MHVKKPCCLTFLHTHTDTHTYTHTPFTWTQVVAPKRAALGEANRKLEGANKKLAGIRARVKELQDKCVYLCVCVCAHLCLPLCVNNEMDDSVCIRGVGRVNAYATRCDGQNQLVYFGAQSKVKACKL